MLSCSLLQTHHIVSLCLCYLTDCFFHQDVAKYRAADSIDVEKAGLDGANEHVRETEMVPSYANFSQMVEQFEVKAADTKDGRMNPLSRSKTLKALIESKLENTGNALSVGIEYHADQDQPNGAEPLENSDHRYTDSVSKLVWSYGERPIAKRSSSEDGIRRTSSDVIVEVCTTDADMRDPMRQQKSVLGRCQGIQGAIDNVAGKGLQTIILALPDDLVALELLDDIQEHLKTINVVGIRFVVLLHDLRWIECFLALGAIPIHDFVMSTHGSLIMATTPFNKDVVLLPAAPHAMGMCDEYSNIFDRNVLAQCYST